MLSTQEILVRLAVGAVLGGLIGFERQVHGRSAGFRTQIITCLASVLIMIVSEYYHHLSVLDPAYVRVDPGRIAAGAITGIGFLGAGVIIKMGANVQGLTTAACLWMVSAIGLSIGAGLYVAGTAACALTLFTLVGLRAVEGVTRKMEFKNLKVTFREDIDDKALGALLESYRVKILSMELERDVEGGTTVLRHTVSHTDSLDMRELVDRISALKGVKGVAVRN